MFNRRSILKSIALLPPALALEAEAVYAQAQGAKPQSINQNTISPVANAKPVVSMGIAYNDYHTSMYPNDERYHQAIVKYFNEMTDGNATGINNIQKAPGVYDFGRVDKIVNFVKKNNLKMKGSNLIWGEATPKWVNAITSPIDLEKVMRGHIDLMVRRYENTVYNWVVVNEPVAAKPLNNNDNRKSVYQTILGERHIHECFRAAHQANPKAQLIINEFDVETYSPLSRLRLENFKRIIFGMLDKGVPLHGVGLQAHLDTIQAINREDLGRFLEELKKAKIDIHITELDIRDHNVKGNFEMRDIVVAGKAYEFLSAVFDVHRPKSVTAWGLHDTDTWLKVWWKRADGQPLRPLPFDANYQPKLMFRVIEQFCKGMI